MVPEHDDSLLCRGSTATAGALTVVEAKFSHTSQRKQRGGHVNLVVKGGGGKYSLMVASEMHVCSKT